ncbi:hypothetical protein EXIGLDRAFT_720897 [Exidia glandulosa HHB12029]|uniref:Uncharacterized protein n=1 Tax=Exidia glandulosa HHB12029 TaxID=1314781 RepID=A0A165NFG1_EXIGL|nr:hypothetical protein EXIGLDRAFT_720897 [Exidia glandulosa HHB12029]
MSARRMTSPSTPHLPPGRPHHLVHHRAHSQPVVPLAATRQSLASDDDSAQSGKFMHSVKKSLRVSRRLSTKGTSSYSDSEPEHTATSYTPPLSSVPPPTIQEIMMGLHLSRTPHLAQPRAARSSAPPSVVVVDEHDSPAPPFLFALMRSRAQSVGASSAGVHRRASLPASTSSASSSPARVPLPPPPKRSSLKKTSTNSSDSSIPTTPGGTGTSSPHGRGTPSPSLSSLSSSRHQLRTPSKLRFSTLFRPSHRREKDDAMAMPPPPPPRKAVRFSPSSGGLATAGGLENVREVNTPVSEASPPLPLPQPSLPPPHAKRQQFVRRVSGRAKATAKEVFAVIADPVSRR